MNSNLIIYTILNSTWLKILLSLIIFYIFVGRHLIKNRRGVDTDSTVWDGISDEASINKAIQVLNDKFNQPFDKYSFSDDVMKILFTDSSSEYGLNLLLQEIAAHCNFDRKKVILRVYPKSKGLPPGRISKLGDQFLIELHMTYTDLYSVIAVVIHEFCHFYLDSHGIDLQNTLENEILTDTATIYFGFDDYMLEGYKPHLEPANKDNLNVFTRVGYLDSKGLEYVINRIRNI